jgi:hypothetical protein
LGFQANVDLDIAIFLHSFHLVQNHKRNKTVAMFIKKMTPILGLFALVNTLCFLFMESMPYFNYYFIIVVNTMLIFMAFLSYIRILKMDLNNPNAMVRSVMMGTLLKMGVFAIAALVYAKTQQAKVGIPTLLVCMGIYLLYAWLEIRWVTKKN